MPKTKWILKHKKQAQHVVELALMMPLFIILFSYTFQIMVETYSKYKFSYIFTNAVRTCVKDQPVYNSLSEANAYDFREETKSAIDRAVLKSKIPYSDIQIGTINTDKMTYMIGGFQFVTKRLFFGSGGTEYFYFIIPVNKAFTEPDVLNKTSHDVDSYFEWYFTLFADKYYESMEEDLTGTGSEGGSDGSEGEGEGESGTDEGTDGADNGDNGGSGDNEDNSGSSDSGDSGDNGGSDGGMSGVLGG